MCTRGVGRDRNGKHEHGHWSGGLCQCHCRLCCLWLLNLDIPRTAMVVVIEDGNIDIVYHLHHHRHYQLHQSHEFAPEIKRQHRLCVCVCAARWSWCVIHSTINWKTRWAHLASSIKCPKLLEDIDDQIMLTWSLPSLSIVHFNWHSHTTSHPSRQLIRGNYIYLIKLIPDDEEICCRWIHRPNIRANIVCVCVSRIRDLSSLHFNCNKLDNLTILSILIFSN